MALEHTHTHTHKITHRHTHYETTMVWQETLLSLQQHLPRKGKVNEEWFVWKQGNGHTMRSAVKLSCQLWRLWEHTAHTNRLPKGPFPQILCKISSRWQNREGGDTRPALRWRKYTGAGDGGGSAVMRRMDIFKQVQLQLSKAATFTANSRSMCAAETRRKERWGGGTQRETRRWQPFTALRMLPHV